MEVGSVRTNSTEHIKQPPTKVLEVSLQSEARMTDNRSVVASLQSIFKVEDATAELIHSNLCESHHIRRILPHTMNLSLDYPLSPAELEKITHKTAS